MQTTLASPPTRRRVIHQTCWALTSLVLVLLVACPASADEKPRRLTIATWNLEWFFDEHQGDNFSELAKKLSAPSRRDWEWKRDKVAAAIAEMKPTILALQEIENQQVLYYLCQRLRKEHDLNYRIAYVLGSDFYTEQDVAILYRSGMVEFGRRLQSNEEYEDDAFYNVSKHQFAKFRWGQGEDALTLTMLNVHLRATADAAKIRQRQLRLAKRWLDEFRKTESNLIVLGDFNTEESAQASPGSELWVVQGGETAATSDDLVDLHPLLPEGNRATHMIGKAFDRILVSPRLVDGRRDSPLRLVRVKVRPDLAIQGKRDKDHRDGYYKIPAAERDLSDHYPLIAEFEVRQ